MFALQKGQEHHRPRTAAEASAHVATARLKLSDQSIREARSEAVTATTSRRTRSIIGASCWRRRSGYRRSMATEQSGNAAELPASPTGAAGYGRSILLISAIALACLFGYFAWHALVKISHGHTGDFAHFYDAA